MYTYTVIIIFYIFRILRNSEKITFNYLMFIMFPQKPQISLKASITSEVISEKCLFKLDQQARQKNQAARQGCVVWIRVFACCLDKSH